MGRQEGEGDSPGQPFSSHCSLPQAMKDGGQVHADFSVPKATRLDPGAVLEGRRMEARSLVVG